MIVSSTVRVWSPLVGEIHPENPVDVDPALWAKASAEETMKRWIACGAVVVGAAPKKLPKKQKQAAESDELLPADEAV